MATAQREAEREEGGGRGSRAERSGERGGASEGAAAGRWEAGGGRRSWQGMKGVGQGRAQAEQAGARSAGQAGRQGGQGSAGGDGSAIPTPRFHAAQTAAHPGSRCLPLFRVRFFALVIQFLFDSSKNHKTKNKIFN